MSAGAAGPETTGDLVLTRRASDELDLAAGRLVAAIVSVAAGVLILALGRTRVAFATGFVTLLAGLGWLFAVRRAARAMRAGQTHTLRVDATGVTLSEQTTTEVRWADVIAIEIDDDAGAIELRTSTGNTRVTPGFGGLALEPLHATLTGRWRATRGDALAARRGYDT